MDDKQPKSGQAIAEAVRDRMFGVKTPRRAVLACESKQSEPGFSKLSMAIRADMLNGHMTCHGGLITTLADSAFAFACNSHNEVTVASGIVVDFFGARL